ncbi:ABC transporter ATP-binding protein [Klebsiella aerogenes]|uniref:ABC transporter ATP-binding protein n=1 Tax=Klebsiella aerogenes TaxID=548 RepID=UPI0005F06B58|nr:ABC transporter ATP-binding protein [Klebsiella aerogenes]EKU6607494.1 ABC transporter ATP-binding protein [Klebsiella aerogenes]EKU8180943.1 ABC transporter ATP-binding protein [Klebsiella aerogenes]EKW5858689.1 ABC transporter ATP-binding protein [Klebsiella aerogenes]ELA1936572.1 ABC transporter ATP-binding protein [Klebsiella aerogenes]ELA2019615.1 ABC transporter ATP-binding protein [Klebsiella aerogenes]
MRSNITELPDISLYGIHKSYGPQDNITIALNDINLDIVKGEFVALCGPSGSGKSTLLNILSGIDKPTAGNVFFLGKNLNALSEKNLARLRSHHLGFIFQFFNLVPVLSVFDNVFYPLMLNGHFNAKEAKARSLHFLDSVGLAHLVGRKPGQLSGGQQQRVAIARALAHSPEVVVADEPTGNLDLATGEAILDLLLDINRCTETTFIISTHSTQLQERARRRVEIKDGAIIYDSAKQSL